MSILMTNQPKDDRDEISESNQRLQKKIMIITVTVIEERKRGREKNKNDSAIHGDENENHA